VRAAFALGLVVALASVASGQERTLNRDEDLVVIPGKDLPKLKGARKERVAAFAFVKGALRPIPSQVDERTPQGRYCFDRGPRRVTDVDDGELDDNDELCFAAGDAGAHAPREATVPGAVAKHEVELVDPVDGGKAWVYVFLLGREAPPAPRHVDLTVDAEGVARWRGRGFEVVLGPCPAAGKGVARLSIDAGGQQEPLAELASLGLAASFRGLPISREPDEIRVVTGSWSSGPVRALLELSIESYLLWGSWIATPEDRRPVVTLTRSMLSAPVTIVLPADLDRTSPSSFSVSVYADAAASPLRLLADREAPNNRGRAEAHWGGLVHKKTAVVARLAPREGPLARATNRVDLLQAGPERGLRFTFDLAGLTKGEYSADWVVHVLTAGTPDGGPVDAQAAAGVLDAVDQTLQNRVP
jgi:hypothetical protein